MMLRHSFGREEEAVRVEAAVAKALADGIKARIWAEMPARRRSGRRFSPAFEPSSHDAAPCDHPADL